MGLYPHTHTHKNEGGTIFQADVHRIGAIWSILTSHYKIFGFVKGVAKFTSKKCATVINVQGGRR